MATPSVVQDTPINLYVGQIRDVPIKAFSDAGVVFSGGTITQSITSQATAKNYTVNHTPPSGWNESDCTDNPANGPVKSYVSTATTDASGNAMLKLQGMWPTYNYKETLESPGVYAPDPLNPYTAIVRWTADTSPSSYAERTGIKVFPTYLRFTPTSATISVNHSFDFDVYCTDDGGLGIPNVYLKFWDVPGANYTVYLDRTGPSDINGKITVTAYVDIACTGTNRWYHARMEPMFLQSGCIVADPGWVNATGNPGRRPTFDIWVP